MKKVAIMTIESINFGNRLQNYALQILLETFGFKVETLRRGSKPKNIDKLKFKIKLFGQKIFKTKGAKFYAFDKKIHKSRFYVSANNTPKLLNQEYDFFIVGSDQVWNPHYNFVGKSDLLDFAKHKQKIAYAASFGVSKIPSEKKLAFAKYLSDFSSLSVREKAGKDIIEELTGKRAEIVLDPTLMITSKKWSLLEQNTNLKPNGKYVLVYSLGDRSKEFENKIKNCRLNGLQILDIFDTNSFGKLLAVGPAEFLYLIDHAELILTDSFHATVFSILFHKSVITFMRKGIDMSSRIVTLADVTGLKDNLRDGYFILDDKFNFELVESNLDAFRKRSKEYLFNALQE